jgi:hypothetical protein
MARGWESKSVEQQQADRVDAGGAKSGLRRSPEQVARLRKKEELLLSRKRVRQQLEASRHPRHHQMLEAALRDLDARLAALG